MALPSNGKRRAPSTTTTMVPRRRTVILLATAMLGLTGSSTAWQTRSATMARTRASSAVGLFLSSSPNDGNNSDRNGADRGLSYSSSQRSLRSPEAAAPVVQASSGSPTRRRTGQLYRDVVIVGGGLAGLSAALYLTQIDPERRITVLDRNDVGDDGGEKASPGNQATMAAAGMLAPNSERLPRGDYRDLCLASKAMYTDFVGLVEGLAKDSGPEGHRYLPDGDGDDMEPWDIGYVASGGFLAPAFAGDTVATWAPPEDDEDDSATKALWLDAAQVRELEPHLHPDVVGGWWFPEDASVDARRLAFSLKAACAGAGIEFLCGPRSEVTALDLQDGTCHGVFMGGRYVSAKAVLVANGAWMRTLLPVPLEPHKGQSLSLRMPADRPPLLRRVLFGGDSYIVPKADGRIVLGATVEAGSFDGAVTPSGVMHVLQHALQLVPGLADLPIEETWAGLRPTTPDKGPILGETPWANLYLAGGYWRNGVLLAPKTGELLASLIADRPLPEEDRALLDAFKWDRFTSKDGGTRMAANARYAASLYPVHKRKSGSGISAAVGTELGSYSTARSAAEERSLDRSSLFGDGDDDDSEDLFERAAAMGREDADVFEGFGNDDNVATTAKTKPGNAEAAENSSTSWPSLLATDAEPETENPIPYDGSADAITVGSAVERESDNAPADDAEKLETIYESIRANKSKRDVVLPDQTPRDDRPDPGFRISHVDKTTGKVREIPPYTQPAAFFEQLEQEQKRDDSTDSDGAAAAAPDSSDDLDSIYASIRANKSKQDVVLPDQTIRDDRPDPGFRISHVDKATGEVREIPPFTRPADFFAQLEEESAAKKPPEPPAAAAEIELKIKPSGEAEPEAPPPSTAAGSLSSSSSAQNYDETTYDGYQEIFKANASNNRQDELKKMKEARLKNRSSEPPQEVEKKD